ncbi:fungal-specific transcription factor domain-containing protein [Pterulicium gracile]|uniref:Fungal-specific transcription factor domain-containing protein n=1 Tax=Pterulicium gracile TaxID=1884261 RepID=A0A5C3QCJ9_9AGAR|nr:fungal-specific transcription factor domain-containing protein [Pterula gracilis]
MSSTPSPEASFDAEELVRGSKKRRLQGACDACRKRKIKCDRALKGKECTNCLSFNILCTQALGRGRRSRGRNTIDNREYNRLEAIIKSQEKKPPSHSHHTSSRSTPEAQASFYAELEPLVASVLKDEDAFFTNTDAPTLRRTIVKFARYFHEQQESGCLDLDATEQPTSSSSRTKVVATRTRMQNGWHVGVSSLLEERPQDEEEDEDTGVENVLSHLESLNIDPKTRRFYGQSSDVTMINLTLRLQGEVLGDISPAIQGPSKRAMFWQPMQVEYDVDLTRQPVLVFPPPDLMYSLVDLYFEKVNNLVPTLHKPTFLRDIERGVHYQDIMFGALVLAACALGAAAGSNDPRMMAPDAPLPSARGLDYVRQIWQIRKNIVSPCSLHELQFLCLLASVSHIHYAGEGIYTICGMGIRYMQELGVHRKNGTSSTSVEGELWRRAYWTFICMDRISAVMKGRPCCNQDEDFDLEWPKECDDEYWEDPVHPFKQPLGKPSNIQFFTQFIKLCMIQGNVQRNIYANKKPRVFRHLKDEEWLRRIVLHLDAELNQFQAELPAHLRWDANSNATQSPDILIQSGSLNSYFHFVRLQIHRPFVLNKKGITGPSLPLLISTNAAYSVCNILDVLNQAGCIINPVFQSSALGAVVIILLNLWSSVRYQRSIDWLKEVAYVDGVMNCMKSAETRWAPAGQLWDVMNGLRWSPVDEAELPRQHYERAKVPQSEANQPQHVQYQTSTTAPYSTPHVSQPAGPKQSMGADHTNGGYSNHSAQLAGSSSQSSNVPGASASYRHTNGRNHTPLHASQQMYYMEEPMEGHNIPSSFGGLDESLCTIQHTAAFLGPRGLPDAVP